jgi:hypothetical protein
MMLEIDHAYLWCPLKHKVYVVLVLPGGIQSNDGRVIELYVQPYLPSYLMALHIIQHGALVELQTNRNAALLVHSAVHAADVSSIHFLSDVEGIQGPKQTHSHPSMLFLSSAFVIISQQRPFPKKWW